VALLAAEFGVSALKSPVEQGFVIKVSNELESLSRMARHAIIRHLWTMRICVTSLTVRVGIVRGHVLENLIDVAGETSDFTMFPSKIEICLFVVIKLNPREGGCDVTE